MEGFLLFLVFFLIVLAIRFRRIERDQRLLSRLSGAKPLKRKNRKNVFHFIEQKAYEARIDLSPKYIRVLLLVIVIVGFWLVSAATNPVLGLFLGPITGIGGFLIIISALGEWNKKQFTKDFMKALSIGSSVLRANGTLGSWINVTLELIDSGFLHREFKIVKYQMDRLGLSPVEALESMAERINVPYLDYFMMSIRLTSREGGDITELFDDIRRRIKNEIRFQKKVMARTSSMRKIVWFVGAVPIGLLLIFWDTIISLIDAFPAFLGMVLFNVVMMGIGILVVKRSVKLHV